RAGSRLPELDVGPLVHRRAGAVEHVCGARERRGRAVQVAELFDPLVDDGGARGRRAPRVVHTTPQLDEDLRAGERDAAGVETGTVQVDLVEQLRDVVSGLRAEDGDRVPARAVG